MTYLDQYLFVLLVGWGILFEAVSGADIAKLDVAVESPAAVAVQAVSVLLESVVPANLNTWTILKGNFRKQNLQSQFGKCCL